MLKTGLLFLAGSLLALPAAAQPPAAQDQVAARQAMRSFAACLLRTNARIAADILARPFGSDEQQELINRRVPGVRNCPVAGLRPGFEAQALAGALSEAGLQARFAATDVGRLTNLTPDTITINALEPRNRLEELGLCVARRAPEAVRAWAASEPGSVQEANVRRALLPQVSPCVDQGQPLRLDVAGLRAILSAGLYRALRLTRP